MAKKNWLDRIRSAKVARTIKRTDPEEHRRREAEGRRRRESLVRSGDFRGPGGS